MKSIMVINGPNLNMLGIREPGVYGPQSLEEINSLILEETSDLDVEIEFVQTNHEGEIIDEIQAAYYDVRDGIVINAGAYTHYSYAIRDAIASVKMPFVEVHLSDISAREPFRRVSVIEDVCVAQISGLGYKGYVRAIEVLAKGTEEENNG
ncbi:type II 3-dehydroquinate dehydratase [Christensenellaceae bacterium OttesenSCG-928-K19]|nr:type II 3-dehydroquinate dehydratase [Christensenellaceae bacterium OttesenSCG-928-K19]